MARVNHKRWCLRECAAQIDRIYLVSFHVPSPNSEQADARLDRILQQSEAGPANSRGQLATPTGPYGQRTVGVQGGRAKPYSPDPTEHGY